MYCWADVEAATTVTVPWVPGLGIELSIGVDGLSSILLLLIGVAGGIITAWVLRTRPARYRQLAGLLVVFAAAMAVLVAADDLFTLFVAWEVTSGLSYLLVGFDRSDAARRAARTTMVVTGTGGVALVTAAVLLQSAVGSTDLTALLAADAGDGRVVAAAWLVLLAAMTKSAQVPFHGWLTGAWTAPTAASALLHAATLVIGGVYLLTRMSPAFVEVPGWRTTAVTVGLVTFVWCHVVAVRARKAKTLLAATTAAQMGVAFACAALGTTAGISAAVALLLVHGAYKAALFLVSGEVTAATGRKDVATMWPATAGRPLLRATLVLGTLALAGIPPVAGWATKEAAVAVLADTAVVAGLAVGLGAALGVVAAAHLVGLSGLPRPDLDDGHVPGRSSPWPPLLLVLPALVLGVWTTPLALAAADAGTAVVAGEPAKVVLVPSPGLALSISLGGIALGVLAAIAFRRATLPEERATTAPDVLANLLEGGLGLAGTQAARVEGLSRAAVVGTVAAASFGGLLMLADPGSLAPAGLPIVGSAGEAVAGGVLLAGVVGVLVVRTRIVGALLLGIVGFAMAGLFALRGAPDLVLTQVVVETVLVLAFVGVLLRLPAKVRRRRPSTLDSMLARGLIAVVAALLAGDLALQLASGPAPRPLAANIVAATDPVGAGKNAVNVILTDFRALDTAGELVVLYLAAVAILALVGGARRRIRQERPPAAAIAGVAPTVTRIAIVVAIHLLVVGHDRPGGGFIGGLVLGAGLALHALGTGALPPLRLLHRPHVVLAGGLVIVAGTLFAPMLVGLPFADMGATTIALGPIGSAKLTSAFVFDIGVMLVVVGLVLAALQALDEPPPGDGPAAADDTPTRATVAAGPGAAT